MRILSSKPSDVNKLGKLIEKCITVNSMCSVGNSLSIDECKEFFDEIEKLY